MSASVGIAAFVLAFLAGSIPFGYLVGRVFYRRDIRTQGSGNIGAMNALRTLGRGGAIAVLLLDALKGFVPTLWAAAAFPRRARRAAGCRGSRPRTLFFSVARISRRQRHSDVLRGDLCAVLAGRTRCRGRMGSRCGRDALLFGRLDARQRPGGGSPLATRRLARGIGIWDLRRAAGPLHASRQHSAVARGHGKSDSTLQNAAVTGLCAPRQGLTNPGPYS